MDEAVVEWKISRLKGDRKMLKVPSVNSGDAAEVEGAEF